MRRKAEDSRSEKANCDVMSAIFGNLSVGLCQVSSLPLYLGRNYGSTTAISATLTPDCCNAAKLKGFSPAAAYARRQGSGGAIAARAWHDPRKARKEQA